MWGYYGDCSKGVCLNHKKEDLHNGINKSKAVESSGACLCIYGHIDYKKEKPIYFSKSGELTMKNILSFVVKCVFTKYEDWEHENEIRYVLLGGNVRNQDVICVDSILNKCFFGVNSEDVDIYRRLDLEKKWPVSRHRMVHLEKHPTKYEIIEP